jgi:putative membrane protein
MMMGWNLGWGWMSFGGLMMVLFWGGMIALAVFAVQALTRERSVAGPSSHYDLRHREGEPTPLELLQTRYAKGEINRDEYVRIRQDLQEESKA